ncbi:MAG TPA: low temperature requirement protein A [Solirubrobacteraceae bacterium]|nr:low temperature requirement protein A [Solirubrobacteraceae bacterium]
MSAHPERAEQRVTPLELFFDLVFVFSMTRVTALMAHDLSWETIGQGLLVLAALWWGWAAYAWLTNHVAGEDFRARLVVFMAVAAMVLVALAVPEAFGDHALLFALAYLVMRLGHLGLYWVSSREEAEVHFAVARLLPTAIAGPLLLVAAAFADGPLQAGLWLLALAIDYGGPLVRGVAGYRVHAAHFAERFSLIVIIALGESIVAIGVGAGDHPLDVAIAVSAVLAVIASAGLWWAYFDVVAPAAHRRLGELTGAARNTLARDSFAYLHLPMIAGIELFALGVEQVVGHVDEPLVIEASAALFGGVSLYLLAHVAFRLRNLGTLNRQRLVAAVVLAACIPLGTELESPVALAVATAIVAALIAYETVRFGADRARVRLEA